MNTLDDLAGQVQTLRDIRDKQRELADIATQLEAAIKERLGESETGTIDGAVVVRWKRIKRRALSQKLLRTLYGNVVEECTETTETRRFEVLG